MGDVVPFVLMGVALVSAFVAQALLLAAREHVRMNHPGWYEQLVAGGGGLRLGGPDDRARRKLARPLLWGRLPSGAADDAALRQLADRFRLALLTVALSLGGLIAVIALRVQSAPAT